MVAPREIRCASVGCPDAWPGVVADVNIVVAGNHSESIVTAYVFIRSGAEEAIRVFPGRNTLPVLFALDYFTPTAPSPLRCRSTGSPAILQANIRKEGAVRSIAGSIVE